MQACHSLEGRGAWEGGADDVQDAVLGFYIGKRAYFGAPLFDTHLLQLPHLDLHGRGGGPQ
jgi:hypothetical protein